MAFPSTNTYCWWHSPAQTLTADDIPQHKHLLQKPVRLMTIFFTITKLRIDWNVWDSLLLLIRGSLKIFFNLICQNYNYNNPSYGPILTQLIQPMPQSHITLTYSKFSKKFELFCWNIPIFSTCSLHSSIICKMALVIIFSDIILYQFNICHLVLLIATPTLGTMRLDIRNGQTFSQRVEPSVGDKLDPIRWLRATWPFCDETENKGRSISCFLAIYGAVWGEDALV
jgi:hypothetical protein